MRRQEKETTTTATTTTTERELLVMRRQEKAPPERGDVPPELFQPRKQLGLVRLLEPHVFDLSVLSRSCLIGIIGIKDR